jgi:hypothetical protein
MIVTTMLAFIDISIAVGLKIAPSIAQPPGGAR